ncbi:MAG: RHS repeat-associated core domain-containing protein [Thermodesulfobacteriota bacterium]
MQTANDSSSYLLGYDQVGSLKAVAAMDGPREGRVVKVVDYDAFGQILSDSNPGLFMPIAFAGGLRDKFTGLVRFLHRDYDPTVGRFTAPDPLGDTGGDHDLYDYCVDDPVGRVDPEGLKEKTAHGQGNRPLTLDEDLLRMTTVATPANAPAHDSTHSTMPDQEADWWAETGSQPQGGEPGSPNDNGGGWLSDKWQAVKDWWDQSPQPNQKDVIVGTADAASQAATVTINTAKDLSSAGGHVDSKVVKALKTPAGSDALKVVKSGASVAGAVGTALDARDAVANMNQQDIDMARLNAMSKQSVDNPNSDAWKFLDDHGTDRGSMFRAAGSVGKAGVGLATKP